MFAKLSILAVVLLVIFFWRPSAANRRLGMTVFRVSWLLIPQFMVIGIFVVLPLGRAFLDVHDTNKIMALSVVSTFQAICCYRYARWFIQIDLGVGKSIMSTRQESRCFWGALVIAILSGSFLTFVSDGYALLFPSMSDGRVSQSLFQTSLVHVLLPLLMLLFFYIIAKFSKPSNSHAPQAMESVVPKVFAGIVLISLLNWLPATLNRVLLPVFGVITLVLVVAVAESKFSVGMLGVLFVWFFIPGLPLKASVASAFVLLLCFYCHSVDEGCDSTDQDPDPQPRPTNWEKTAFWVVTLASVAIPLWLMIPRIADFSGSVALFFAMQFWTSITVLIFAVLRYNGISNVRALAVYGALVGVFLWQSLGDSRYYTRDVRLLQTSTASPGKVAQKGPMPKPLSRFAADWFNARKRLQRAESCPVILVASAGGGIRAAYWSAGILAALESESIKRGKRPFSQHVLAISSVSGGSLGAAVYVSSLHAKVEDLPTKADLFLRRDLVGPIVGPMMIRDLFTSAVRYEGSWDRGVALETAFERAWNSNDAPNPFEMQIESLWPDSENSLPALLLNSTDAESGVGIVKSNCQLSEVEGFSSDRQQLVERLPMRLSTACLLSARFPYASPEGRVSSTSPDIQLRLVDGGYCDNSGNATLLAILDVLEQTAKNSGFDNAKFVVLSIDNAPVSAIKQQYQGGPGSPARILSNIWQRQTTMLYTEQIKKRVGDVNFFGNWQPKDVDSEYPLSWYQSSSTCNSMRKQISQMVDDNQSDFNRIIDLLLPSEH